MAVKIEIRPARDADLDAVLSVYEVLKGPWPDPDDDNARDIWNEIVDNPGTTVFLAEIDGAAVAAATLHVLPNLTFTGSPYALVENVAVLGKLQGQGIGRNLMEDVIAEAERAGCYKIMLLTGNYGGAAEFYEKLGFDGHEKQGMIIRYAPKRLPG